MVVSFSSTLMFVFVFILCVVALSIKFGCITCIQSCISTCIGNGPRLREPFVFFYERVCVCAAGV